MKVLGEQYRELCHLGVTSLREHIFARQVIIERSASWDYIEQNVRLLEHPYRARCSEACLCAGGERLGMGDEKQYVLT